MIEFLEKSKVQALSGMYTVDTVETLNKVLRSKGQSNECFKGVAVEIKGSVNNFNDHIRTQHLT